MNRLMPRHSDSMALAAVCVLAVCGCAREQPYPSRPITLVCPWAAGGGTDRVSRQMAAHLEQELGVPVSVINATGGKGVTGHSRALDARPDGYTLGMITLELNMLHWSGLTDLSYDDCIPLMSINEDYAAVFTRRDAPWQTLGELEADIAAHPGALKASGTSTGAAWHLALAGWLLSAGRPADDVVWISSTGAGPSLQELMSGGVDLVCCSLPEADVQLQAGEIRALGVMAPQRVQGYEQVPTFVEQGRDWSLGGWRGLALPLGTPQAIVDRLFTAIERVVTGQTAIVSRTTEGESRQTFPEFMASAGFDHTCRPREEFQQFLTETDQKFGQLLTSESMRSVNRDRYNPLAFPLALMALAGMTLVLQAVPRWRTGRRTALPEVAGDGTRVRLGARRPPAVALARFALVVLAIALYCLLAEQVGFVLLAGVLLFAMLVGMGTPWLGSAGVVLLVVPGVYQLFSSLLRVSLPRGWWGW